MVMHVEQFHRPSSLREAVALLADMPQARLVAGGTDVVVEISRRAPATSILIDITALDELRYIRVDGDYLCIGALVTHALLIADPLVRRFGFALAQAAAEVGAPQIRNRATLVGNLVTASPANDTITALTVHAAQLVLVGPAGERIVAIDDFYRGFRETVLQPVEIVREVRLPLQRQRASFQKLGLRRAQAIAVVNCAVGWELTDDGCIHSARIALGSVGPTIVRSAAAEAQLNGRIPAAVDVAQVARTAAAGVRPIDDVRGPARYRTAAVAALMTRVLDQLIHATERADWPAQPVLLQADHSPAQPAEPYLPDAQNITIVNGRPMTLNRHVTLLAALREAGLTGTKEGCSEGECGACTVWLNGAAVMACLTPAGQATDGHVTTIEGLAADQSTLHALQQAFVTHGAVQCGFCIPGIIMSAALLLEEITDPTVEQIQTAISGNICRCTGYRKIIEAIQSVAALQRRPVSQQHTAL